MCALVVSYIVVLRTLDVAAYVVVVYGPVVAALDDVGSEPRCGMSQLPASVPPEELLLELLVELPLDPEDPLELPDDPLLDPLDDPPLDDPELDPPLDALPELLALPLLDALPELLPELLDPELPLSSPEDPPSPVPPPELSSPDSLPRPASLPPSLPPPSPAVLPESSPLPLLLLLDVDPELVPPPELVPKPELEPKPDPPPVDDPLPAPCPVSDGVEAPLAHAATTRVVTTSQLARGDRSRMVLLSTRGFERGARGGGRASQSSRENRGGNRDDVSWRLVLRLAGFTCRRRRQTPA